MYFHQEITKTEAQVQVSTEKNKFLYHGQGAVHGRNNQK